MSQTLSLKIKGLITNPNTINQDLIDGALSYADNIVINKDNVAESRRGFGKYNNYLNLDSANGVIGNIYSYQDTILVHHSNQISRDVGGGSSWTAYTGTFVSPSAYKMQGVEENQNLYVTTSSGVKKLDAVDSEFYNAGVVPSLDGFGSASGGTGWFTAGTAVAYRMVWTREDANENLVIGAPSSRFVVINNTGSSSKCCF